MTTYADFGCVLHVVTVAESERQQAALEAAYRQAGLEPGEYL